MIQIVAWFGTLWGRVALVGGGLALMALLYTAEAYRHQSIGRSKQVADNKRGSENANAKSQEKHREAQKPGALDRLRRDPATCVDC